MKLKTTIFAFALAAVCAIGASAQSFLGFDGEESTSIGIYIKDLENGKVLINHNSDLALTPASVMKVITTATALSIHGPEYTFNTPVVLTGEKSTAKKGAWNGNLVIRACGDPTIESENFKSRLGFCDSIAAGLRRLGITSISGKIIVEQNLSDAGPIAQWEIEDVAWPYGAGLFGLNYKDNTFTLYPATKTTKPHVPGLKIEVRKSSTGNDLIRGVERDKLVVYARDPNNKKWALSSTMPDPAAVLKEELKETLTKKGIAVADKAVTVAASSKDKTVYRHRSPKGSEIMRSLMVRSDNLFAEGMLRSIAPGQTRKNAIAREKELWASRGINSRYTIINDGSGLTRANRLSARFIGDVLEYMAGSERAGIFTGFFPRAGKEGTLRSFLSKTPLEGKVALKTGSVSSVQCYAGYKFNDDGKPTHIVVVLVNGFFCPRAQVRKSIEKLLLDNLQ